MCAPCLQLLLFFFHVVHGAIVERAREPQHGGPLRYRQLREGVHDGHQRRVAHRGVALIQHQQVEAAHAEETRGHERLLEHGGGAHENVEGLNFLFLLVQFSPLLEY